MINRRTRPAAIFIFATAVLFFPFVTNADDRANVADRPNVVLMMADDLGYQDLSCYGSESIRTPVLDKMASEGIRLTSYYAGSTVCTPSRMALLTGAYPTRVGWPGGVVGYKINGANGLATEALTIADVFRGAGYATGLCGKWHLGDAAELQPMKQGFDFAFYIKRSNNQTKKLWRDEELVADPFDNRRLSEQFASEAIKFIQSNRAKPFFLYLPFTAPHFPAQAHPDWKGKSSKDAYGDVVEELDSRIGEILKTLETESLDRKTIVVFISDNGPEPGQQKWASAKPFRGLKWSSLEGGTRVPCIVRWPGVIPAKLESDELTTAIDLLPTLAHACGIDLKTTAEASPKIDGVNVWNTLINNKNAVHARTNLLYWNGWAKLEAIRVGQWKLFLRNIKEVQGSDKGPVLIDLKKDPAETTNLAQDHPEKVIEMQALANKLVADIEANSIPLGGPSSTRK
ncbi:MAG: arylsulfatase A [Pirellulaceae bacterium]|jgi:arylsulfatase A